MNSRSLFLLVAILFFSVPLDSIAGPVYDPGTWFCYVDGVKYESTISRDSVLSSPGWSPNQPIPLAYDRALKIARDELRKLVKEPETWEHESIMLKRLRGPDSKHWFFVISFAQEFDPEQFSAASQPGLLNVLIDFSGRPGRITPAPAK